MRDNDTAKLAENAGLLVRWRDAFGKPHRVSPETIRALVQTLGAENIDAGSPSMITADASRPVLSFGTALKKLPKTARIELEYGGVRQCEIESLSRTRIRLKSPLPPGYHVVHMGKTRFNLACAPARCFAVSDALASNTKIFGVAVQLYSLRHEGDLGYGDFGALEELIGAIARRGVAAIALSPVHAMFGADATRYSPYSPSNREFLNGLHADAAAFMDRGEIRVVLHAANRERDLAAAHRRNLIDWPQSASMHRIIFERLFDNFRSGKMSGGSDFAEFRERGGDALLSHAMFEALDEQSAADKPAPSSLQAKRFAEQHPARVTFHQFMQWCAARGLSHAQSAARTHRMPLGLIADLAVGFDPSGSECWSQPHNMLIGAQIGAPPDELNAIGQSWGLTTFSPHALQRDGFSPFLRILRAAMRHSGGVRLDHVMSLMRLWLVPDGAVSREGAYLRYPFQDLIRLVALESWRHRCIVIGEDLGTVPRECRTQLARAGILGMDVLPFMRQGRAFIPPARWRSNAVAMTSTHDTPTVAGWWEARDIHWRKRLHLFGDSTEVAERENRESAKEELARAFARSGVAHVGARATPDRVEDAAIDFVARTASPLVLAPLEDLVATAEQPNLPGTIADHPNWRRRYSKDATQLLETPRVAERVLRLAKKRSART